MFNFYKQDFFIHLIIVTLLAFAIVPLLGAFIILIKTEINRTFGTKLKIPVSHSLFSIKIQELFLNTTLKKIKQEPFIFLLKSNIILYTVIYILVSNFSLLSFVYSCFINDRKIDINEIQMINDYFLKIVGSLTLFEKIYNSIGKKNIDNKETQDQI